MALEHLDAGSVRVLCQSNLPIVGVCGAVFFSRRYSAQQWCSLVAISIALTSFYHVKWEVKAASLGAAATSTTQTVTSTPRKHWGYHDLHGHKTELLGVAFAVASMCCNCLGALLVEKFLKRRSGRIYEQKCQLVLGEVIVNAVLFLVLPFLFHRDHQALHSPWHRGFFAGWDARAVACLLVWIPAGWSATMLVKEASNLVKTISQGASSVLTYIFSIIIHFSNDSESETLSMPVVVLAMAVLFAALTFGMDTGHSRPSVNRHQKVSCN
eukprot:TRINITY_DN65738_c0_g1_i1.p1 TRINITY_DN65738_c0_g1~~TRINITY_DN65738_c0_g1_i1.p1  ORF type:complete len:269 (+),score=38.05 TRINITY_DN65738_c0_g1_i1:132-938(+)